MAKEATRGSGNQIHAVAKNSSLSLAGTITNAILSFVFAELVTHKLSITSAGALFEAIAIFTICTTASVLGADVGLLRMMPRRLAGGNARSLALVAVVPTLAISSVLAAAVFIFAPGLASVLVHHAHGAGAASQLRIMAFFIPLASTTTVVLAGVRAWSIVPYVTIQSVLVPIARPILFGALLAAGMTPLLAAASWCIPIFGGFALALLVLARRLRRHARTRASEDLDGASSTGMRADFRSFWSFTAPRSFQAILAIMIVWLDVVLVGAYESSRAAAVYAVASRYLTVGIFALGAGASVIGPELSLLLHKNDLPGARNVYQVTACWVTTISWPLLITLAVFAPAFMGLFGPRYRDGATALMILVLAALVSTGSGNNAIVLLMGGKSAANLCVAILAFTTNLVLNIVLIPRIGFVGAAISWGITMVMTGLLIGTLLWRIFRFIPFSKGWFIAAASAVGCYGVIGVAARLAFGDRSVTVAISVLISSIAYAALLYSARRTLALDAFAAVLKRRKRKVPQHARGKVAHVQVASEPEPEETVEVS